MKKKKTKYTAEEIALAQRLFDEAKAAGTLKQPRGLIALSLGIGFRQSVAQAVSPRDYLKEARQQLAGQLTPDSWD